MHAEVGDQHAGAHVHRRALVEQRLAEAQRLDLDHVVAGLGERQADHLERPRVAAGELRQLEPPRAGVAAEQRDLARADPALDLALDRPALGVDVVLGGEPLALRQAELLGGELGLVVLLQLRVPGQDLGVALQPLDPHLAGAGRGRRARPALRRRAARPAHGARSPAASRRHGARPRRTAPPRTWRSAAPRRWRPGAGSSLALASGRPALSFSSARQDDAVGRVLGQRLGKGDLGHLGGLVVLVEHRRQRLRRSPAPAATCAACARGTGAEKRRLIGRIGRQGAAAFSRSQLNSAVKAARTRSRKRCSIVVTTCGLAAAAMPLPQTRRKRRAVGERAVAAGDQQPRPLRLRECGAPSAAARAARRRGAPAAAARRCLRPRSGRWPARSPRPPGR